MNIRIAVSLGLFSLALPFPSVGFAAETAAALGPSPSEEQIREETSRNLQTARWMVDYDKVAWATTDLLLKESKETLRNVSPVWFCIEKGGAWYALYGGFRSNSYEIAACYRRISDEKFEKIAPPEFPDKERFARAVNLTLPEILDTTRRTTVRFNYYVRGEPDGIDVYYVPAFQTDGKLAYGIQHTFHLDSTGEKVVSHAHYGHSLVGARPSKNKWVTLEMPECSDPTPQAIFTMMSYRSDFADILTHCRDGYFGMALVQGQPACIRTSPPPALADTPPGWPGTLAAVPPGR
jgi:hypothetical protein